MATWLWTVGFSIGSLILWRIFILYNWMSLLPSLFSIVKFCGFSVTSEKRDSVVARTIVQTAGNRIRSDKCFKYEKERTSYHRITNKLQSRNRLMWYTFMSFAYQMTLIWMRTEEQKWQTISTLHGRKNTLLNSSRYIIFLAFRPESLILWF